MPAPRIRCSARCRARFPGLVWHHYSYDVPAGAVELARTDRTTQAFRLGDACWGVQFHPEVTALQLERWIADFEDPPPDPDGLRAETPQHIGAWNELGRTLCGAFLTAAERAGARAASDAVAVTSSSRAPIIAAECADVERRPSHR